MEHTNSLPYGDYAETYLELGYSPLPLPPRKKSSPPEGYTGYNGKTASADDVANWVKNKADGNISLRVPKGVVGIDGDPHKSQEHLEAWNHLLGQWGELPDTAWCSSRDNGMSGIRLYQVPKDYVAVTVLPAHNGTSPGEVIQFHHRYAVVPPSIHPDTEKEYEWVNGYPLAVDDLPELPKTWQDGLDASKQKQQRKPNGAWAKNLSGFTCPDVEALVASGIPSGQQQEATLRDVAWVLVSDGIGRDAAAKVYRAITEKTTVLNPSWPWTYEDFTRHYDSAVEKLGDPEVKDPLQGELTDAVLSDAFSAEVLAGRYCYCPGLGWMSWDGKRWVSVADEAVKEQTRLWVKQKTMDAGKAIGNGENIADNITRAKKWWGIQSKSRIEAITSLSKGIVLVDATEFDAQPDLLNVNNGIVDLRTGKLMPHDPSLYMTKLAPTDYKPDAKHADWTKALEALPEKVRAWYLLRLGQAITGHMTPDDLMIVQQGVGANGKSTIMSAVQATIGDYYHVVSHRALLADASTHPTELMDFRGARVSVLEETPEEGRLSVTRLKMLAGTPQITARRIQKDSVTFDASHSLFINTNYRPIVDQVDNGTWRRLALVVFPYRFVRPGKATGKSDRPGDPQLRDRLRVGQEQREAVLASLVSAAVDWYDGGKVMPELPERVEDDTLAWRKESDFVLSYAEERLVFDASKHVMSSELLADYNAWLEAKKMRPWGEKTFVQRFEHHEVFTAKDVEKKHTKRKPGLSQPKGSLIEPTDSYQAWHGIGFVEEADTAKRDRWARSM